MPGCSLKPLNVCAWPAVLRRVHFLIPPGHVCQRRGTQAHALRLSTPYSLRCHASKADWPPSPIPEAALQPGLYLVATPIGNLEDITLRAARVLRQASLILAEDTRRTGLLRAHLGISTPMLSFHRHNEHSRQEQVMQLLRSGQALAMVSDAGLPLVNDPGASLVAEAVSAGIKVIPIPGPSAFLAGLVASGLPTSVFTFCGYLPDKREKRRQALRGFAGLAHTLAWYVAPHDLAATLADMVSVLGSDRNCVVARELTKIHEEFFRATLQEAADRYAAEPPKGEITLLVQGAPAPQQLTEQEVEGQLHEVLRQLLSSGCSLNDAAKQASLQLNVRKSKAYHLALSIKGEV
eukprot:jgi/Astpho2/4038/e_gw1.00063.125.1_t